jgi:vacuolar-type H+-ATPase subunit I/STV1
MRSVYNVIEFIAVAFAFAAAWFWFRASHTFATDINGLDTVASIQLWLGNVAYYNRLAALCAAFAAIAEGARTVAIRVGLF